MSIIAVRKNTNRSLRFERATDRFTEQGKRKSTAEEPRVARCGDNFALFSRFPQSKRKSNRDGWLLSVANSAQNCAKLKIDDFKRHNSGIFRHKTFFIPLHFSTKRHTILPIELAQKIYNEKHFLRHQTHVEILERSSYIIYRGMF